MKSDPSNTPQAYILHFHWPGRVRAGRGGSGSKNSKSCFFWLETSHSDLGFRILAKNYIDGTKNHQKWMKFDNFPGLFWFGRKEIEKGWGPVGRKEIEKRWGPVGQGKEIKKRCPIVAPSPRPGDVKSCRWPKLTSQPDFLT